MRNGSLYHAIEYTVESSEDMSVDARPRTTSRSTGSSTTRSDGRYASDHASSKKIRLAIDTWKWQVLVERKKRSHGDVSRGYSVSVAQRDSGADSTKHGRTLCLLLPCLVSSMRVSVCGRQQSRFFDEYARCPAPGSIAHAPGTASQALEMVRFGLQRLTVCRPVRI